MDDIVISEETRLESDVITLGPMYVQAALALISDGGGVYLRFTSLDAIDRVESAMRALYHEALLENELAIQEELELHEDRMRHTRVLEDE